MEQKLKLNGIQMEAQQWAEFLQEPYKTEMIQNLKEKGTLEYPCTSLHQALNKFNWDRCKHGNQKQWRFINHEINNYTQGYANDAKRFLDSNMVQYLN